MAFPNLNISFDLLINGSIFEAVNSVYTQAWGVWFWPLLFFATLGLVALKTQSPAMVAIYTIIGNTTLALLLPVESSIIFYVVLMLSMGITLYMVFGSPRTD